MKTYIATAFFAFYQLLQPGDLAAETALLNPREFVAGYHTASFVTCAWDAPVQAVKYQIFTKSETSDWHLKYTTSVIERDVEVSVFQSCSGYTPGNHWLRVRAYNPETGAVSDYSNTVLVVVPDFGTPTNLRATVFAPSRLALAWQDVSNETGYEVWRQVGEEWSLYRSFAADINYFEFTGLSPDTTLTFKLRAVRPEGVSEFTAPITTRTFKLLANSSVASLPGGWVEVILTGEVRDEYQLRSYIHLSHDLKDWQLAEYGDLVVNRVPAVPDVAQTERWSVRFRVSPSSSRWLRVEMPQADYQPALPSEN